MFVRKHGHLYFILRSLTESFLIRINFRVQLLYRNTEYRIYINSIYPRFATTPRINCRLSNYADSKVAGVINLRFIAFST